MALSSPFDGARTIAEPFAITQSTEMLRDVDCGGRSYRQVARISSSGAVANADPRVRVRSIDASAARDALDAGVDLLVTDDPAIVSYAAHNEDLLTVPLPWDRTYVVLASESAGLGVSETLRLTLVELLADAVRADSRAAQPPFWWESNNSCSAPAATTPVAPAGQSPRVVYLTGDRIAQGIAERLVALAGSRSAGGQDSVLGTLLPTLSRAGASATAAALAPSAFDAALRAGDDVAYVLPVPRFAVAPCQVGLRGQTPPKWRSLTPLIDTRSHAIVRRGRVGLSVDADGSVRLLDGVSGKNGRP